MDTFENVFAKKKNVIVVMAHPDDAIVYFGALINKLVNNQINVYVLTVTNGARGSRDNVISEENLAKTRLEEEIEALRLLGVPKQNFNCLNYKDGEVESNLKLIGEIAKYIRKYKVDLVCTHEPSAFYQNTYNNEGFFIQHRDHRKVGEATIDAVYPFSRDRSFFPEHFTEGVEPHSVFDILVTDEIKSNFEIDFTNDLQTKRKALAAHQSQMDENFVNEVIESVKFGDKYLEKYFYINLLW